MSLYRRIPKPMAIRIRNFGGLDTESPEELVSPNRFRELIDFRTDRNGALELRERVTYLNGGNVEPVSWIDRIVAKQTSSGEQLTHIVWANGRALSTGSFAYVSKAPESSIDLISRTSGSEAFFRVNSNYPVTGVAFRDYVLAANEFTPFYPVRLDDNDATQHYEGVIGRFALTWRQRLAAINTPHHPCETIFSSILRGTMWDDPGGGITQFTPLAGDFWEPLGARPVIVSEDSSEYITGGVVWNNRPIIGTNKALYYIDENFGSFEITRDTGVIERTLCLYRGAVFFLGDDDVYMMTSLNGVQPITRKTVHSAIFDSGLQTKNTLQPNEWVVDDYGDWNTLTGAAPDFAWNMGPATAQSCTVNKGGYITPLNPPAGPSSTYGDREFDPILLANLPPDYGGGGGIKEHLSNFIRLDFEMTGSWGDLHFDDTGQTDDAGYDRNQIQFFLAVRQADTLVNLAAAAYTEVMWDGSGAYGSGYYRDNRRLSFVIKIDAQTDANVFDRYFQFMIRIRDYEDTGSAYTSTPHVHRARTSWLSAVQQGSEYLDYRQQPVMAVANDKLWLHLTGKSLSEDSYAFVMDNRGEWTKYRNLDAFAMAEVNARHPTNNTIHRRFLIGKRWNRYSSTSRPFYIETEEYPDYVMTQNPTAPARADTGKLYLGDPWFYNRLRYILLTYEGAYNVGLGPLDDKVWLKWRSSGHPVYSDGMELTYQSTTDDAKIDTARKDPRNWGNWFQWRIDLYNPWTLTHGVRIVQLQPLIIPMTFKPTVGQVYTDES